ncbi:MAG: autotransporter domain-containing protein, partial [Hyphomicrobiales bacterium]
INPQVTATREAANPLAGAGFGSLIATQMLEQSLTFSYAGLFLDGYTETGTTNPLTLDDRDVHIASARAALALPFEAIHANGALTTVRLIGGVEVRTQFGDDAISGTLLGQSVSTTLDDDDVALGGFLGLSGEYQTTSGLIAYANAEGLLETDASWQLSADAGLRIAF